MKGSFGSTSVWLRGLTLATRKRRPATIALNELLAQSAGKPLDITTAYFAIRLQGDLEAEPFNEATLKLVEKLVAFLRADKVEVRLYDKGFLRRPYTREAEAKAAAPFAADPIQQIPSTAADSSAQVFKVACAVAE